MGSSENNKTYFNVLINVQISIFSIIIISMDHSFLRPHLKQILFPVQRPGEDIIAEWELFLPFCFFFFSQKFQYFLTKKKKGETK